jgi:hypothetical protein
MARKPTKKTVKARGKPPAASPRTQTSESQEPTGSGEAASSDGDIGKRDKIVWAGVLLFLYTAIGTWGHFNFSNLMGYYDLFADALLAGRLHIAFHPAQGYIHDMIPFEGRYYIQWGPLPGIFHALPKVVGLALSDRVACILTGWLTSLVFLAIMLHLRRRFFPEVSRGACRWFFFASALATPTAIIALRGTVYHESIGVGALCILASLYAFARSIESSSLKWAAVSGAMIGLAMLCRVTLVFYAPALFIFLGLALYVQRRSIPALLGALTAFSVPVFLGGALQMIYNAARFGSPWDYGNNYLVDATGEAPFALSRVPENIKHYLLVLPEFKADFPWVEHVGWTPLVETLRAEDVSSLLLASPFVLLGLVAWKLVRPGSGPLGLRIFFGAAALGSGTLFLMLLTFASAARRYTQDFFSVWMVIAFIGFAMWRPPRLPSAVAKPAGWAVLAVSVFLHLHLSFTQPFNWDPPDINVMRTFVMWSPVARSILPVGERFNTEEAMIRNDMATLALKSRRYREAVAHLQLAAKYMPGEPRIQKNLELALRALERQRIRNR